MEQAPPSSAVNHSHALLNALRAALSGEEARALTRELLRLPADGAPKPEHLSALEYVEELFGSFAQKETIILCLDEPGSFIVSHFESQIEALRDRADKVEKLLQVLASRSGNYENAARELTSFYVGHFRAREAYIHGLLLYADTFSNFEMKRHWEDHLEVTLDLIEDSRELLIEVSRAKALSSYMIQRIYDSCILIPASLRCQSHDMCNILHLNKPQLSFQAANLLVGNADEWTAIGLNAEQAGYWAAYKISPPECSEWLSFGFLEARSAGAWKVRGFDPETASDWASNGYDPSEAYLCRHGGISTPDKADQMKGQLH